MPVGLGGLQEQIYLGGNQGTPPDDIDQSGGMNKIPQEEIVPPSQWGINPPWSEENVEGKKVDIADKKGLLEGGNIDLSKRPIVPNGKGFSTVYSMSFNEDGKEILVPRVSADGKKVLSPDEAIKQYHETGQHLGKFDTPEAATAYGKQLHLDQQKQYAPAPGSELNGIHEKFIAARLGGHEWSDIHEHLAQQYDAGATREQIGFAPVSGLMTRLRDGHLDAVTALTNPQYQEPALPQPETGPRVPLTQVAAVGNDNSPFAWTRGRAPVTEGGSAAAGSHVSIPPSSIGVQPATKLGPTTTGGPKWKMQQDETIGGNMGKATEADKYEQAVRQQKIANENVLPAKVEDEKFLNPANSSQREMEEALTGVSQPKGQGREALKEDAVIHLREHAIGSSGEEQ